jgi:threonine dehydrogenase-like Zn-dependent dehydrogenase
VLGAGTIALLAALALRLRGIEVLCFSLREPPYLNSTLVEEIGGIYVGAGQTSLREASEAYGPFDLIFEATGVSALVFEAAAVLAKNGVLVLSGVTGGDTRIEVNADRINQGFVLGNKVMVGTVNASRHDFVSGVDDLIKSEACNPGWLGQLLTTPVDGLEHWREIIPHLEGNGGIKVHVNVAR